MALMSFLSVSLYDIFLWNHIYVSLLKPNRQGDVIIIFIWNSFLSIETNENSKTAVSGFHFDFNKTLIKASHLVLIDLLHHYHY